MVWMHREKQEETPRIQNFALKSILGMRKHDSATEALTTLNYLNLQEKRNIHQAVFAHKALTGRTPKSITAEYLKLLPYEGRREAVKGNLNIPIHKKAKYEQSVLYRTVKAWYNTDPGIRNLTTFKFKTELQRTMQRQKNQI